MEFSSKYINEKQCIKDKTYRLIKMTTKAVHLSLASTNKT